MKRMLINATQQEELRVALVDGQRLYDLDIELPGREQKKANIYKGKITRIEPSLEAAFVDYGAERHGFLPLKEIARSYFKDPSVRGRLNIKDVLSEGQELIVQIDKEERGQKGAALTTFISLAGCYVVLMPNNPRAGGISRRIEGEERDDLKAALRTLDIPKGMGCIVRTAGVGREAEELQWDMGVLLNIWDAIQKEAEARPAPFLIHQESDVLIRAVRDSLRPDVGEIIIDKQEAFDKVRNYLQLIRPDFVNRVKMYSDREFPLFNRYQIESQIESAFKREVQLPSGGSIVIDPTEALISIDINSARATKGSDIEETALNTNVEAAQEVARQLRLRDIGGLIVIDFIDMSPVKNQREVERVLSKALQQDRARVQIGRISRFGLLEMSRQRLKPSLGESSQETCPRCSGVGRIRGIESLALSIFRLIEEEATKESTSQVQAFLPVDVATFLLNEKRKIIAAIEKRRRVKVVLVPHPDLETPHFEILRLREEDVTHERSFELKIETGEDEDTSSSQAYAPPATKAVSEVPAVQTIQAPTTAPVVKPKKDSKPGLLKRLFGSLFGSDDKQSEKKKTDSKSDKGRNQRGGQNQRRRRNQSNRKPHSKRQDNQGERSSSNRDNRSGGGRRNQQHDRQDSSQRQESSQRQDSSQRQESNRSDSQQDSGRQDSGRQQNRKPRQEAPKVQREERVPRGQRQEQQKEARAQNRKIAEQAQASDGNKQVSEKPSTSNRDRMASQASIQVSEKQVSSLKDSTRKTAPAEDQQADANKAVDVVKTNETAVTTPKPTEQKSSAEAKPSGQAEQASEANVEDKASESTADVKTPETNTATSKSEAEVKPTVKTETKQEAPAPDQSNKSSEAKSDDLGSSSATTESAKQDAIATKAPETKPESTETKATAKAPDADEKTPSKPAEKVASTATAGKAESPMAKPASIEAFTPMSFSHKADVDLSAPVSKKVDVEQKSASNSPMAKASIASVENSESPSESKKTSTADDSSSKDSESNDDKDKQDSLF